MTNTRMRVCAVSAIFWLCALGTPVGVLAQKSIPLTDPPPPQSYIAPGPTGIYAELNGDAVQPVAIPPHSSHVIAALPAAIPFKALTPYVRYTSPDVRTEENLFNIHQIVVKFVEGSSVRLRNRTLAISTEEDAAQTGYRLARMNLNGDEVSKQLRALNRLLGKETAAGRAAPQVDEKSLTLLRRRAERQTGTEMPDPNLFYFVHLRTTTPKTAATLLHALQGLSIIEAAYFQPIPFDATDIPPTTTIDVTSSQGYFLPSPTGVDVNLARHIAGGRGEDVRIVDIEGSWDLAHEDLPAVSFGFGVNFFPINGDHGTAVLGELAAQENGFGANGVASLSQIGWSSFTNIDPLMPWKTYFYSIGNALLSTGWFLRPGDLTLIEQHFPNPSAGPCPNTCNCGQFGYVAVETMPYEHAAISLLTGAGIVVVEAAGNGQVVVTPASARDSGAIVVGASDNALAPACFTNFGPRLDVHAWGGSIGSLGFGDTPALKANGADQRQWYTTSFGGTSGATPIVTGAAALIQSTRAARGLERLDSIKMRTLLVSTGTPQLPGTPPKKIGPLPNLAAAIATYISDSAQFVTETGAPTALSPGAAFGETVSFQNTGGLPWAGYSISIAPSDSGAFPWTSAAVTVGTASAQVMPGDLTSGAFSVTAPTAPGNYQLQFVLKNATGQDLAFSPRQPIAIVASNAPFDNASLIFMSVPTSLSGNVPFPILVKATNTGSTTWTNAQCALRLTKSGHLALPQPTVSVSGNTAPGAAATLLFVVQCNSPGEGSISVQMAGPQANFGQQIGATIVCN